MATNTLQDKYIKILEENFDHEQIISQQKDRLVSLEKKIAEAERKIQEHKRDGNILKHQTKQLKHKERCNKVNLEQDIMRLDDIMVKNRDYREQVFYLLKLRCTRRNNLRKVDQQLAAQRALLDELESGATEAFSQKSKAEIQRLELLKSLEEKNSMFSETKTQLKMDIQHETKLLTFMEKKLQNPLFLLENKNTKKTSHPDERDMYKQSISTPVDATEKPGPSQILAIYNHTKEMNFKLMNYNIELEIKKNMLENRIREIENEILILEQESKQLEQKNTKELNDLEPDLENQTKLADMLEDQNSVAQRTLDELTAAVSRVLDDFQKPSEVTSENLLGCLRILEEYVQHMIIKVNNEADEQNLPNFDVRPDKQTERSQSEFSFTSSSFGSYNEFDVEDADEFVRSSSGTSFSPTGPSSSSFKQQ